ncbi:unnamed protein product [Phytomonas sp. Hart1]|nr:unnamed protein product [Phytomonas sp. Hart1]|eukprot:CCW69851.1 unnamed protein product [Phytomonas sp. isolate Hart1]
MSIDWNTVKATIEEEWDTTIIPALSSYIAVPNQSPSFDPEWATNGLMENAFAILINWVKAQNLHGLTLDYIQEKGRTPFLLVEVLGTAPMACSVLMYGHMDKQPPLRPWGEGLDPTRPVVRDGKLYGRGASDDGYALFSSICSIASLQRHGIPHGRLLIAIESGEESGSPDLDYFMERFCEKIGIVDLVICLDSGCMNYEQVWLTTSLRGVADGVLRVRTLSESMHSGVAGGVVPDSFRILRELLDRLEDSKTGRVRLPEAHADIPEASIKAAEAMNAVGFKEQFSTLPGVSLAAVDNQTLALRNFWEPSLTVVGANLPDPLVAGNVIRAETAVKLSIRTPPNVDSKRVLEAMGLVLEDDPPSNARVQFEKESGDNGSCMPELKPWLHNALEEASLLAFGKTYACQGMGGAIPFVGKLIETYKTAQVIVTGVLGPQSNAHGPNEFLHIPYVKGLTFVIARVISDHFHNTPRQSTAS